MNKKKLSHSSLNSSITSVLAALLCILIGLVVGFLVLLAINPAHAWADGFVRILKGGFHDAPYGVGKELANAAPLIITGLSVGFAFKTGLFNIGAPGQLMVGGFVAVYVGVNWTFLPDAAHWIVGILMAMLAGGLWGLVPGLFKALFNVHEVISSIMMNYIGMYGVNLLIERTVYDQLKNQTVSVAGTAVIPKGGLDQIFVNYTGDYADASTVNIGIFIAILMAIAIFVLLYKTQFGFELRACGLNRHASRYAGINEKRTIALSMVIAGTLAAYTVTVMWGATLVGRLLIAFVFPLKNPRKAMVGMSVLCTVFYVLLVMAHTQGAAIALLFAFAISMSGLNPTAVASAGRMTSVTSMGIMLPVASSGAILMPWVIGIVAERAGLAAGMASNIVPCVGLVVFTLLVARLPEE